MAYDPWPDERPADVISAFLDARPALSPRLRRALQDAIDALEAGDKALSEAPPAGTAD